MEDFADQPSDDEKKAIKFRERIRLRLSALDQTKSDLAREIDISPQALSNMINRFPNVNYQSLERIASHLDVSVAWLIDGNPAEAYDVRRDLLAGF